MSASVPLVEVTRGPFVECVHSGHAVICNSRGEVVRAWGNPDLTILPRSSCKMIQALPLVESGAADAAGLSTRQLALSCASHNGAAIHVGPVRAWLSSMGLGDDDLRCGPQEPNDRDERDALIRAHEAPCQVHNNCSGKHLGFLTLNRHLGGGSEYVGLDHPVQLAVRAAFEEVTEETSPGYGIDGCSAPNFASSLTGLARAMAGFAAARPGGGLRAEAQSRLVQAMMTHPELVAGEGRACTGLMRAMHGRAAVKTGAEGVFVAILPDLGLGVAVKITDGATRASECATTAILTGLGVLDPQDPAAQWFGHAPLANRRGIVAGEVRPAASLTSGW
ncbi:asparaginase [Pseudooceanicola sp.]|uniref:asparaginase n=1 Tax=Pseudooceanicola sp. TaxID=1914328 RepID=UPI0026357AD6|nr:asparaginase [Pseudooceanicola sp.]MDF1856303.1 asparaginase [Pseudooceanicola sp.]